MQMLNKTKTRVIMKVGFIGIGKLGEPCAYQMSKQYDVVGYDSSDVESRFPQVDTIAECVQDRDIVFVAVPTPHDPAYDGKDPTTHLKPKDFDYSIVESVLAEVAQHATQDQLVVLISTVLPGTTRRIFQQYTAGFRFVYNSYLIAMGTVEFDMVNPEMIIIGTDDGSLTGDAQELIDFYKPLMENDPRIEVGTWDEAESMKIFYNTWISSKLALVNMMQDVAEKNGNINVDVVTSALAKSTFRINGPKYMTAGLGDGGACHPRDNIALRSMASDLDLGYDLFDAIMVARDKQAENMAKKLVSYGLPVVIVGKSYKPGVPYSAGSISILTGEYVKLNGGTVHYIDNDNCDDNRDNYTFDDSLPFTYLMAHSDAVTYDDENISNLVLAPAEGSVIVDPWRKHPDVPGVTVVHYGNTRKQGNK
jgi:UDPglucose 6-dehydrogenase